MAAPLGLVDALEAGADSSAHLLRSALAAHLAHHLPATNRHLANLPGCSVNQLGHALAAVAKALGQIATEAGGAC